MSTPEERNIVRELRAIGLRGPDLDEHDVREAMKLARNLFRTVCKRDGYEKRSTTALLTKFTDAGRRSAPWKPASSKVPGRPQDGADGNRIKRWLLDPGHKFYATEVDATLVEIKYIFQALSMRDAPSVADATELGTWSWLVPSPATPGSFSDPIRLDSIDFETFATNPRIITSGHIDPLDRTGSHEHSNTSLMLKSSNDLQGSLQINELLDEIWEIGRRHEQLGDWSPPDRR